MCSSQARLGSGPHLVPLELQRLWLWCLGDGDLFGVKQLCCSLPVLALGVWVSGRKTALCKLEILRCFSALLLPEWLNPHQERCGVPALCHCTQRCSGTPWTP